MDPHEGADTVAFRPLAQPPANVNVLRAAIGRYAKAYNVPVARVQRWVSFTVLTGTLERLHVGSAAPVFVMKGGVTLELRFKHLARATRDLDTILTVRTDDPIHLLDDALAEPYAGFSCTRVGEPRAIGPALQVQVKLAYRGRSWGTVPLELSQAETTPVEYEPVEAVNFSLFGLDGPATISCLSLRYQIAQKLHAVTTPPDDRGRDNPRFRDLADLLLLRRIAPDLSAVRLACEDVFGQRQRQSWPPTITAPASWADVYAALARDLGLATTDINAAVHEVQGFVDQIMESA